jgi:transcriptional regulator with XRE-family HTH domain
MAENNIHHGRNIKRFREMFGIKQEAMAAELGDDWSQRRISLLEQKEEVEDAILEEIAKVLKVPVEAIKNFDEEKALNIISGNTFENCNQPASVFYNSTINPIEKWMEALDQNKQLYERLLQSEKEKVELLQQLLKGRE